MLCSYVYIVPVIYQVKFVIYFVEVSVKFVIHFVEVNLKFVIYSTPRSL